MMMCLTYRKNKNPFHGLELFGERRIETKTEEESSGRSRKILRFGATLRIRREDFERDIAFQVLIAGPIDLAHAAAA